MVENFDPVLEQPEPIFAENGVESDFASHSEADADKVAKQTAMLGAVLEYITDEELEELDVEYLFETTEGLREFWETYREQHKTEMAEEIKAAIDGLSLEELEQIREQLKMFKH